MKKRRVLDQEPSKVGVEPKGPTYKWVPKKLGVNRQCRPVIAIVPSLVIAIAGSLSPSGRSNAVFENVRLPGIVPANAKRVPYYCSVGHATTGLL